MTTETRTHAEILQGIINHREVTSVYPVGSTQIRRALRQLSHEPHGALRKVIIAKLPNPGGAPLETVGPRNGTPVIVSVPYGTALFTIPSGNVVLICAPSAVVYVTVQAQAHVTVFAEDHTLIRINVEAGGAADLCNTPGTRGELTVAEGGEVNLHGDPGNILVMTEAQRRADRAATAAQREAVPFASIKVTPGGEYLVTRADHSTDLIGDTDSRHALIAAGLAASEVTPPLSVRDLVLATINDFVSAAPADVDAWAKEYAAGWEQPASDL